MAMQHAHETYFCTATEFRSDIEVGVIEALADRSDPAAKGIRSSQMV
jgi:hypothetical protein